MCIHEHVYRVPMYFGILCCIHIQSYASSRFSEPVVFELEVSTTTTTQEVSTTSDAISRSTFTATVGAMGAVIAVLVLIVLTLIILLCLLNQR